MAEFGRLLKCEKTQHALCWQEDTIMYFCAVNENSRVMICTLSSAHWQQVSKSFQPCSALSWKDWQECAYQYNSTNNNKVCNTNYVCDFKCWNQVDGHMPLGNILFENSGVYLPCIICMPGGVIVVNSGLCSGVSCYTCDVSWALLIPFVGWFKWVVVVL